MTRLFLTFLMVKKAPWCLPVRSWLDTAPRWILSYILPTLTFCFIIAPSADAEYYELRPSITIRETYDDNVFFQDTADLEHFISSELALDRRTERGKVHARCAWDISEYQRHSEFDTLDQSYHLSAMISPTQTSQVGIAGHYVRDYTFSETLTELGIVAERSIRTSATVTPQASITLDPRNRIDGFYRLNKTQFRLERYPDYRGQDLDLMWTHALRNERTSLIAHVAGNQVDYTIGTEKGRQRTLQVMAGFDHQLTETLQVTLQGGFRSTKSKFPRTEFVVVRRRFITSTRTDEEHDTSFVVNGALTWRFERARLSANLSRDFAPSIYGEGVTRNRLSASLAYRLSEKFDCVLTTTYSHSETEGFVRSQKSETYLVRPLLRYQLDEHTSMRLCYTHTRVEDEVIDDARERNRIFFELSMEWPQKY